MEKRPIGWGKRYLRNSFVAQTAEVGVAVEAKSSEITAMPALLELLAAEGCTVTIDAMGRQTANTDQIAGEGADYALALKANQGTMYDEVKATFGLAQANEGADLVATRSTGCLLLTGTMGGWKSAGPGPSPTPLS